MKDNSKNKNLNLPASKLPREQKKLDDFRSSLHWRVFRILSEFVDGWQFLADFKKTISFFGSARFSSRDQHCQDAEKIAKKIVEKLGYAIMTGGGPGIMEAGNKGAVEGNGASGCVEAQT